MSKQTSKSLDWWRRDAERNERVRRARLQRDARKAPGKNLEEGSDLVRFAHEFAAAFEKAARAIDHTPEPSALIGIRRTWSASQSHSRS